MDRLFSTAALLGVYPTLDRPVPWLKTMFFGDTLTFTTPEIAFDKLKARRKLAPFVSPKVPGKIRGKRGRSVETFEPAYVKPKNAIEPDQNFVRLTGEAINGELAPEQRYNQAVIQELDDQDAEITRREEWMCAQVLQTGSVIVEGEDYPAQNLNFNRDAALTKQLAGAARWGEAGISPRDNIRAWATEVALKSGGSVTDVVFGAEASELFVKDDEVKSILDNRRQADGQMQLGPVATGSQDMVAAYLGSIGQFNFWQYTQIFEDEDGNITDFFPSLGCLVAARPTFNGAFCYGAIRDNRALRPMARFPKMWSEEDPSVDFLMTQSAPLPAPREVDATSFIMVR
ncbi:major capsid protein [Roseibium suaedae]|uniref:Phage major capsid protein E n=1 Tax=Roseibium suaedae TaxID=735517 RepID=A0A1M7PM10_9HYPH|nr:major capsid protein [Roseibium suaedae]SHN18255.1 Phage major capsid protein E [Roseibium suaedae]